MLLTVEVVWIGQALDKLQLRLETIPGLLLWKTTSVRIRQGWSVTHLYSQYINIGKKYKHKLDFE